MTSEKFGEDHRLAVSLQKPYLELAQVTTRATMPQSKIALERAFKMMLSKPSRRRFPRRRLRADLSLTQGAPSCHPTQLFELDLSVERAKVCHPSTFTFWREEIRKIGPTRDSSDEGPLVMMMMIDDDD